MAAASSVELGYDRVPRRSYQEDGPSKFVAGVGAPLVRLDHTYTLIGDHFPGEAVLEQAVVHVYAARVDTCQGGRRDAQRKFFEGRRPILSSTGHAPLKHRSV